MPPIAIHVNSAAPLVESAKIKQLFVKLTSTATTEIALLNVFHRRVNTVMTAALAAFYQDVRVGHVEAGLRSFNRRHPFPEEVNRRFVGLLADLHFAPTERARQNLLRDGVTENSIFVTGNTIVDALQSIPPAEAFDDQNLDHIDQHRTQKAKRQCLWR